MLRRMLILVLATGAATPAALVGAQTRTRRPSPPVPRVTALGTTRAATLVSYCWTVQLPGGSGQGICADGIPGHPRHTLRWRPGRKIVVDLRLPAHDVQIEAVRVVGPEGSRPTRVIQLSAHRSGPTARRWVIRLPRRAARDTELLISASFARGDVAAEVGIRPA